MPSDTAPRKFDELDEAARDAIRAKQRHRKEQRLLRKSEPAAKQPRRDLQKHDRVVIQGLVKRPEYNEKHGYILRFAEKGERVIVVFDTGEELALKPESLSPEQVDPRRTQISLSEYFGLCSGGHTSVPMPCNEASVAKLMELVRSSDAGLSALLRSHNYFTFQGSLEQQWDPLFYARLSWEGFFVITTQQRVGGQRLRIPLPELQPVYGVLTWPDFERSSLVGRTLAKLAKSGDEFVLVCNADPNRSFRLLNEYHSVQHGSSWLTREYFEMMRAADAAGVNFRAYFIDMFAADDTAHGRPLCGEVGFGMGGVYTSLSGWMRDRDDPGVGTTQLVLLGRWLQARDYRWWSLGHCYSPQLDYKRQLGQRIYDRLDFLHLLALHRGEFRPDPGGATATQTQALRCGDSAGTRELLAVHLHANSVPAEA